MKRYTLFVLNKVEQQTVLRHGPNGLVERKNPGTPPSYPKTFVKCVYADTSDPYGDDFTKRTQLWEDTVGSATDQQIYAACPRIRDDLAHQIRMVGNYRLGMLATPYMDRERETWKTQEEEALAWLADNAAPAPMLTAQAAERGIPLADLVAKVMENVNVKSLAGKILGQQQALLDKIYSEQSVEKLLAITWPA